jgi:hypothetical protein
LAGILFFFFTFTCDRIDSLWKFFGLRRRRFLHAFISAVKWLVSEVRAGHEIDLVGVKRYLHNRQGDFIGIRARMLPARIYLSQNVKVKTNDNWLASVHSEHGRLDH